MSDSEEKVIHVYDGIRELDNQLPRWWIQIFYASIFFSVVYFAYYHILETGKSQNVIMDEQLASEQSSKPSQKLEINAALFKDIDKKEKVAEGKAAFLGKCQSCHGAAGGGGIGPNLTDKFWIHGAAPEAIGKSIYEGYPAMGMPAWGAIVTDSELVALVAYVVSLKGTNPPGAKAPQGQPVE